MDKKPVSSRGGDRRAQFTNESRPRRSPAPMVVLGAAALLFVGAMAFVALKPSSSGSPAASFHAHVEAAAPAGADVVLAASTFDDGRARFFRYVTAAGREVRFFVMRSSDGVIRAAFDACDVCYRERLGYRQQGDVMICNACDMEFPSTHINVLEGGCNPAPIERTLDGDRVILSAAALARGVSYF